jgi:hypothetical protein
MNHTFTITTPTGIDIHLDVDFSVQIHGRYRPATWGYDGGDPPDYPEVEVSVDDTASIRLKDGRRMPYNLRKLPSKLYEELIQSVEGYADSHHQDDSGDYDPGEPDDYDDPRSYNVDCDTDHNGVDREYRSR